MKTIKERNTPVKLVLLQARCSAMIRRPVLFGSPLLLVFLLSYCVGHNARGRTTNKKWLPHGQTGLLKTPAQADLRSEAWTTQDRTSQTWPIHPPPSLRSRMRAYLLRRLKFLIPRFQHSYLSSLLDQDPSAGLSVSPDWPALSFEELLGSRVSTVPVPPTLCWLGGVTLWWASCAGGL